MGLGGRAADRRRPPRRLADVRLRAGPHDLPRLAALHPTLIERPRRTHAHLHPPRPRHGPRAPRRRRRAARTASPPAAAGCTCGSAWSAATSAAATTRPTSTRPPTPRAPSTRSSARSSRARTGRGATSTRSRCASPRSRASTQIPPSPLMYAGRGSARRPDAAVRLTASGVAPSGSVSSTRAAHRRCSAQREARRRRAVELRALRPATSRSARAGRAAGRPARRRTPARRRAHDHGRAPAPRRGSRCGGRARAASPAGSPRRRRRRGRSRVVPGTTVATNVPSAATVVVADGREAGAAVGLDRHRPSPAGSAARPRSGNGALRARRARAARVSSSRCTRDVAADERVDHAVVRRRRRRASNVRGCTSRSRATAGRSRTRRRRAVTVCMRTLSFVHVTVSPDEHVEVLRA